MGKSWENPWNFEILWKIIGKLWDFMGKNPWNFGILYDYYDFRLGKLMELWGFMGTNPWNMGGFDNFNMKWRIEWEKGGTDSIYIHE